MESAPHSRAQLKAWQAEIDARVPTGEHLTRLYLRWEPGDIWAPVQRYVLWELVPNTDAEGHDVLLPEVRRALNGPHPRSTGHHDAQRKRWVGGPCAIEGIDRGTYEVFKETGRYGKRWWVFQGKGGHPIDVPWIRQKTAKLMGEPYPEPPSVGDLPYCEPGTRIFDRIAGYDKYRSWRYNIDWAFRNHAHLSADETREAEEYAALMTHWWDSQIAEVMDEVPKSAIADIGWEAKGAAAGGGLDDRDRLTDANTAGQITRMLDPNR